MNFRLDWYTGDRYRNKIYRQGTFEELQDFARRFLSQEAAWFELRTLGGVLRWIGWVDRDVHELVEVDFDGKDGVHETRKPWVRS